MSVSFLVPFLPQRVIVTSRRDNKSEEGNARHTEQGNVRAETREAILNTFPELPAYERASVALWYRCRPRGKDGRYRGRSAPWELMPMIEGACMALKELEVVKEFAVISEAFEPVGAGEPEGMFITIQGLT